MKLMVGQGQGFAEVVAATWKKGGAIAFFNGNFADVIRTAPQKSVQLAAFDFYKKLLSKPDPVTGKRQAGS